MANPRDQFVGVLWGHSSKALMFQDWFWHSPMWLPRSHVDVVGNLGEDEVILRVSNWMCAVKGVEEFSEVSDEGS